MLHLNDIEGASREYERALEIAGSIDELNAIKKDLESVLPTIPHRDIVERFLTQIEQRRQKLLN